MFVIITVIIYNSEKGMEHLTYRDAVARLSRVAGESARYEAALLIEKTLRIEAAAVPLLGDGELDDPRLEAAIAKREEGYPLQYILGEWDFFGLTFEVNESCLCPRPDTETAVEKAIELIPAGGVFLELCTGSGCIPVAVCKYRPDVRGIATDLYPDTLETAKRNAWRNGVEDRIDFVLSDLFDTDFWHIREGRELVPCGGFDAVISNPPYIPTEDIDRLSNEVKHEPRAALDGGEDGLDFYRAIVSGYGSLLKESGTMILEIGYDQGEAISLIARESGYGCRIFKDLGGNDRVAVVKK